MEARQKETSIAALHPEWQLLLHAAYLAAAHGVFPDERRSGLCGWFGTLVRQLQPNSTAHVLAAAVFCRLHAFWVKRSDGQGRLAEALGKGEFHAVFTALTTGCKVRQAQACV